MTTLRLLPLVLASALVVPAAADGVRNPFGRKTEAAAPAAAAAAPTENAQLQFCGTYGSEDDRRFLIFNVTKNRSAWLSLAEEGPDGEVVQAYDAEASAVQLEFNGQPLNLALQAATIKGGGMAMAAVPTAAQSGSALVRTVKVNPTPADERARLEAVAAEVRRRRAMRQAAKTNQNPEAPASPR